MQNFNFLLCILSLLIARIIPTSIKKKSRLKICSNEASINNASIVAPEDKYKQCIINYNSV